MARYSTISLHTVLEDYIDFSGHEGELDEPWVLKQANDAVERLVTDQQMDHRIEVIDIRDYKGPLPKYFRYVVQAAYRIDPPDCCTREQISQFTQKAFGTGCNLEINVICPKCKTQTCDCQDRAVEVDVNRIYETAHPELFTRYMDHFYKSGGNTGRGIACFYDSRFHLMSKTSNQFFNVPWHVDECLNLVTDCEIEYDIHMPNIIVNFPKGEVLLSYLGYQVDEQGYRMIPNVEIVFQAINYYIEERMAFRNYRLTKSQNDRIFWQQMLEMKDKMISRARSQLQIPDPDEWWQFVSNHWRKVIPYYKWERNLNRGVRDEFRYPDQTYNMKGYKSGRTIRRI